MLFLVCFVIIAALWAAWAGTFLVVDAPSPSDLIVVLAGDQAEVRFRHGLSLLRQGYATLLVLDASTVIEFGRRRCDLAAEYLETIAPDQGGRMHVCSFDGHSTRAELTAISDCLRAVAPGAKTAVVVTSNFHTRRAVSVARRVLPQYAWSVAAAPDPDFGAAWWKHRQWAKATVMEWQKLLWWNLVEKWTLPSYGREKAT